MVEYDPPSRVAYRTRSGAPANLGIYDFEAVPEGTRVRYSYRSSLSVASALVGGYRRDLAARRIVELRKRWFESLRHELEG